MGCYNRNYRIGTDNYYDLWNSPIDSEFQSVIIDAFGSLSY